MLVFFSLRIAAVDGGVYHITPLPDDPCSTQPCLTISQFAATHYSNSSSYLKPSNTTMIFLGGNHRLDVSLIIANVTELIMVSGYNQSRKVVLVCNKFTNFRFTNVVHVQVRGLYFTGCGSSKIEKVDLFNLENANFLALGDNEGRALELTETTSTIVNTAFISNSANDYQNSSSECDWGGGAIKVVNSAVSISNCTFTNNSAPIGGAILIWLSNNVTIESSTFIENRVACDASGHNTDYCDPTCCSGLTDDIGYGGAIAAFHSQLKIHKESKFAKNKARGGGGLYGFNVTVNIYNNEFIDNLACFEGGAIDIIDARLLIEGSQISGNAAKYGGALDTFITTLRISGTKICDNRADYDGGAMWAKRTIVRISESQVYNNTAGNGGAMHIEYVRIVDIKSSKIYANSAGGGGAMFVSDIDTLTIEQSELYDNNAGCGGLMKATSITTMTITVCSFRNNTSGSYGGAIRIYEGTTTTIEASNFSKNIADVGGAVFANSITKLIISNTIFDGNKGDSGVVYLLKVKSTFYSNTTHYNNKGSLFLSNSDVHFDGRNSFIGNDGTKQTMAQQLTRFEGGAITAFQSNLAIYGQFTLADNFAQNGGAIYAAESKLYVHKRAVIANNNATSSGGGIYLYQSEINCQDCCRLEILNNSAMETGGGIHAISSSVKAYTGESQTTTSVVHFSQNVAKKGGGLCLEVNAKLYVLKPYSSKISQYALRFTANMAEYGGAAYVADDTNSVTCASTSYRTHYTSTECFMQTLVLHGTVSSNVNLVNTNFTENYAEISGSTIYGGLLDRCTVSPSAEVYIKYNSAQPGAMSGTEYITSITNINVTSVNSDPVRICFCNSTNNKPDCRLKPPVVHVPKGRNFTVSLVAVDQLNNTISHATIHSLLNSTESGVREGQLIQKTSEACTDLTFSVFSPHQTEELILYPEGPCKDAKLSRSRLVIQFTTCECPIGFQPKVTEATRCECECDSNLKPYVTDCVPETTTLIREGSYWLMYINTTTTSLNSYNYLIYPHCPYDYCHPAGTRIDINLNTDSGPDAQCALNRSGRLCGSCQAGLSLSIGTSCCLPCSPHWPAVFVVILIAALLGGIAIVAILLVLNLTVAVGTLNGIIFYANIVAAHNSLLLPFSRPNFISIFIAWLNLDFGFNTCFFEGMDAYWKTWLQLAFPAYVIFLVAMIIFISERSIRFGRLIGKRNPVATLATLVLLSYAKFLHTVIAALSFAILDYPDGSREVVWLPDASVGYLSGKHIPLFIAASLILLAGVAYTTLLFSWQWLLRHQDKKIFKWVRNYKIYTFLEPYHAPYNFQHRYWTGLLLIVRVILYLLIAIVSTSPGISLVSIGVVIGCLLLYKALLQSRVYKKWPIELLELTCYFNILVLSLSKLFVLLAAKERDQMVPAYLSVSITFVLFLVVIIYHLITELFLRTEIWKKMTKLMTTRDSDSQSEILEAADDRTYCDSSEPTTSIVDGPSCEFSLTQKDNELESPLLEQ
jgi:hypothetical protein